MSADDKTHYEGDGCQPPHAHGHPNPDFYEEDEDPADIMKAFDDGEKGTTGPPSRQAFANLRAALEEDPERAARVNEQRAKLAAVLAKETGDTEQGRDLDADYAPRQQAPADWEHQDGVRALTRDTGAVAGTCGTCSTDAVLCHDCPGRLVVGDHIATMTPGDLRWHLHAAWSERMTVEELLCEALGYIKSDGGPDDPNGGGYITGEGDVVTIAMEAARKLKAGQGTEPDAKAGLAGLAQRIDMHGDEPKESQ